MKSLPTPKNSNSRIATLLVVTGLSLGAFSAQCNPLALSPKMDAMSSQILASAPKVPNADLSNMYGRFVDGSKIRYFGIEMISYWTGSDGTKLNAGAGLSVDLSDPQNPKIDFRPTVSVTSGNGQPDPNNSNNQVVNSGGLDNIHGITQSIQVAGIGNNLKNTLTIDIVDPNSPDAQKGFSDNFKNVASQNLGTNVSISIGNGSTASVTSSGNGLQTMLTIPGQGIVMQQVSGSIGNGLSQRMAINSNNNTIQSDMNLKIQMSTTDILKSANDQAANLLRDISKH